MRKNSKSSFGKKRMTGGADINISNGDHNGILVITDPGAEIDDQLALRHLIIFCKTYKIGKPTILIAGTGGKRDAWNSFAKICIERKNSMGQNNPEFSEQDFTIYDKSNTPTKFTGVKHLILISNGADSLLDRVGFDNLETFTYMGNYPSRVNRGSWNIQSDFFVEDNSVAFNDIGSEKFLESVLEAIMKRKIDGSQVKSFITTTAECKQHQNVLGETFFNTPENEVKYNLVKPLQDLIKETTFKMIFGRMPPNTKITLPNGEVKEISKEFCEGLINPYHFGMSKGTNFNLAYDLYQQVFPNMPHDLETILENGLTNFSMEKVKDTTDDVLESIPTKVARLVLTKDNEESSQTYEGQHKLTKIVNSDNLNHENRELKACLKYLNYNGQYPEDSFIVLKHPEQSLTYLLILCFMLAEINNNKFPIKGEQTGKAELITSDDLGNLNDVDAYQTFLERAKNLLPAYDLVTVDKFIQNHYVANVINNSVTSAASAASANASKPPPFNRQHALMGHKFKKEVFEPSDGGKRTNKKFRKNKKLSLRKMKGGSKKANQKKLKPRKSRKA